MTFNLHFPFESSEPVIEVSGGAGFWDEPASGLWQAHGNVYFKLWIISAEAAALINNKYAAGCVHVGAEGVFGGGVQGRYRFSDGNIDGGLFGNDNCSDQLKQYSQKPEKEHKGGFVKEESAIFLTGSGGSLMRGMGALGGASAVGQPPRKAMTFTLPGGTLGQELRITSSSGTPVVTLSGPGGQTLHDAVHGRASRHRAGTVHERRGSRPAPGPGAAAPSEGRDLARPARGRVAVRRQARIRRRRGARHGESECPARSRGQKWSLAYKIGHFVAGTKVRSSNAAATARTCSGRSRRAKGTLSFSPQEALGRSRKIYAYLLNSEGATVRELTVGRYTAPGAFRPGRPRKARIARHGTSATITWSAVAGARQYKIVVRGSDGRLQTFFRKPHSRSAQLVNVLPFESFTATVTAEGGPNMLPGPGATARLAPLKIVRPSVKRRRGGKRG